MQVSQFKIEKKHRQDVGFVASLKDFTLSGATKIGTSAVVDNPAVSLYCFDDLNRQAVFVELPEQVDLTKEPFVYQSQYEYAQQVFTLPFDSFNTLAKTLPAVHRPIFIHITFFQSLSILDRVFRSSFVNLNPNLNSQFKSLSIHSPHQSNLNKNGRRAFIY